jgi:hypothetical protein
MSYYGDVSDLGGSPSGGFDYPIITQPTQPIGVQKGAGWMNTTTGAFSVFDGAKWIAVVSKSSLPPANAADELLISTGPGNTWTPNNTIFLGNF